MFLERSAINVGMQGGWRVVAKTPAAKEQQMTAGRKIVLRFLLLHA
jgi:hypothetical protein